MIRLLIIDAGSTLGRSDPPGSSDLAKLSPFPKSLVQEEMRRFLHCTSDYTNGALRDFCEAVHIDPDKLPQDWTSSFTVYGYAQEAVTAMITATGAPAVVLSNMSSTTGPSRMRSLHAQIPPIDRIYMSYDIGLRKPDRRIWRQICDDYGVHPSEAVHIGDRWINDVRGAIRAGCNAIFITGTREGNSPPPYEEWPASRDRIQVVSDLSFAVSVASQMHKR